MANPAKRPEETISRDEALKLGLKTYFTNIPCRYGHISPRFVSTRVCMECSRLACAGYTARVARKARIKRAINLEALREKQASSPSRLAQAVARMDADRLRAAGKAAAEEMAEREAAIAGLNVPYRDDRRG